MTYFPLLKKGIGEFLKGHVASPLEKSVGKFLKERVASPFGKRSRGVSEGRRSFPLWKRGIEGDFRRDRYRKYSYEVL